MDILITEESKQVPKKTVGTQVNSDIYEKLKEEANEEFMSISDLMRKIIYIHLRDKESKGENN